MKSNISKKEIESGKEIISLLSNKNPKLLPHILKEIISDYKKFIPHHYKYGLWSSKKIKQKKIKQKYDKILLLISGITAGGKDTIRQEMEKLCPNLFFKTITATSRPPREGESHGKDYYFFNNPKIFKESIKNGEFLEYIKRGSQFYGLPKKSIDDAIKHPCPIICSQIEMSGWSKAEKYISTITEKNIFTVKIFIMPDMTFSEYKNWLIEKRNDDNFNSRLVKTGWEIKKAPKKADFIITNRIKENSKCLTYTTQTIINQVLEFSSCQSFSQFPLPFSVSQEIFDIESIIKFHDLI